jgi:hypothetical protein
MNANQRKIVLVTTFGKRYRGIIDIPNESFRTSDLMNASNLYWKNPNEKCFNDAILMYDADLFLDDIGIYKSFKKIQIKLHEIIFFCDDLESIGNVVEKSRAHAMREKAQEECQTVTIITPLIANSFYEIIGKFYGLFKKKSNDRFIPLSDATIFEIQKEQGKLLKKEIKLPHSFLGVSTKHIESLSIE